MVVIPEHSEISDSSLRKREPRPESPLQNSPFLVCENNRRDTSVPSGFAGEIAHRPLNFKHHPTGFEDRWPHRNLTRYKTGSRVRATGIRLCRPHLGLDMAQQRLAVGRMACTIYPKRYYSTLLALLRCVRDRSLLATSIVPSPQNINQAQNRRISSIWETLFIFQRQRQKSHP